MYGTYFAHFLIATTMQFYEIHCIPKFGWKNSSYCSIVGFLIHSICFPTPYLQPTQPKKALKWGKKLAAFVFYRCTAFKKTHSSRVKRWVVQPTGINRKPHHCYCRICVTIKCSTIFVGKKKFPYTRKNALRLCTFCRILRKPLFPSHYCKMHTATTSLHFPITGLSRVANKQNCSNENCSVKHWKEPLPSPSPPLPLHPLPFPIASPQSNVNYLQNAFEWNNTIGATAERTWWKGRGEVGGSCGMIIMPRKLCRPFRWKWIRVTEYNRNSNL